MSASPELAEQPEAELDLADPNTVATRYWHQLTDGRIQCDLCPRNCRLRQGQRGFCFVRGRTADQIVMASYGRSSGVQVDPIEKKPLHHFYPGSQVLSFGTTGCNLGCQFCQNWDISRSRRMQRLSVSAPPESLATRARQLGCRSVAFTYNDPVVFLEYAMDTAVACREQGLKTVAVSAGYINPEPRTDFFKLVDAANIDLKGFEDGFYRKLASGRLAPVLDTLQYLASTDVWLEITTLLIPGRNDSDPQLAAECAWIAEHLGPEVPLHFSAFHPSWRLNDVPRTPAATLLRAERIAREHGLKYVYLGNVRLGSGQNTTCPSCDRPVIVRDGYSVRQLSVTTMKSGIGRCAGCGAAVPGHFADQNAIADQNAMG